MNKYKSLAKNTVIFAIGSFGSKILNILLISLYTGILTESDMGISENIVQTANFLIPVFTVSITEAIIRYGVDKDYNDRQVFSSGMALMLMGLTLLALLSPVFNVLDYLRGQGFILYLYVCASAFRSICSQFVRARGLVKLFAFDGILATLSLFLFNLLFLAVFKLGIVGYILSVVCSDLCSGIFLMLFANLQRFLSISAVKKDMIATMLRYSLPLIPAAIMWSITSVSDRIFVTEMVGAAENGLYAVAYKVPNLISIVSTIFFSAWNMSAISENKSKDIAKFYSTVFSSYQSIMYIATAGLILMIKPLTHLLVRGSFFECYKYMPLLVLAVLMLSFSQFLSSIYCSTQHTLNSFITSMISAVTNIVLNFLLIPKYGVQGAAFSTFVSYLACYIARIIDSRRYIPFRVSHMKTVINMVLLSGMTAIFLLEIKGWVWYLIGIFLVVTVINFSAVMKTLRKILAKRKG